MICVINSDIVLHTLKFNYVNVNFFVNDVLESTFLNVQKVSGDARYYWNLKLCANI